LLGQALCAAAGGRPKAVAARATAARTRRRFRLHEVFTVLSFQGVMDRGRGRTG
jgi:hypothetical protein